MTGRDNRLKCNAMQFPHGGNSGFLRGKRQFPMVETSVSLQGNSGFLKGERAFLKGNIRLLRWKRKWAYSRHSSRSRIICSLSMCWPMKNYLLHAVSVLFVPIRASVRVLDASVNQSSSGPWHTTVRLRSVVSECLPVQKGRTCRGCG